MCAMKKYVVNNESAGKEYYDDGPDWLDEMLDELDKEKEDKKEEKENSKKN